MAPALIEASLGIRDVAEIRKEGRRQLIKTSPRVEITAAKRLLTAKAYANEPYYAELLDEPRTALNGASINDLLRGWSVVVRAVDFLEKTVDRDELPTDAGPEGYFPSFVPVLQSDAIRRGVSEAAGISLANASSIVEFLTYRGGNGQELWAQPLVPVSDEVLAPVFTAATHPNLHRLIDVWLRQLDIDMGLRGPAFERYVQIEVKNFISTSPLLGGAKVIEHNFTLRPTDERREQIDLVIVLGSLVILGESKCSVQPTEAKQFARHSRMVEGAVEQILRKAESVDRNRELFQGRLAELGIQVPSDFEILPLVTLNGPIHAGIPVRGVPIVDLNIFGVFFSGEIVDLATQRPGEEVQTLHKRILYTDLADAVRKARYFFMAPPQLDTFVNGLKKRYVPVPLVSEKDWTATYVVYECVPDLSHLKNVGPVGALAS